MPNEPPDHAEVQALRALIDGFIHERLQPKLEEIDKKLAREIDSIQQQELHTKRQRLLADYQRESWLDKAADQTKQLQLATHIAGYTHSGINLKEASNIYYSEYHDPVDCSFLGSHTFRDSLMDDVAVGNAAVLYVYKLLTIKYKNQSILNFVLNRSSVLIAALSDDHEKANHLLESFLEITGKNRPPASHKLTRQIYFPLVNFDYHLLAPLFPSSLVHRVHTHLRAARQARYDNRPLARSYSEYPNIAIQIFGGTKPQNISQLNSERYGENWLLPSFPPSWRSPKIRPPLRVKTVFQHWFGRRHAVRELTNTLAKFLAATDRNNVHIRRTRAKLVERLCDELVQFAAELLELTPGWTAKPECRLDQTEALWLDPGRAQDDETFAALYQREDWPDEIARRFGNWLNGKLRDHASLALGDAEHTEWQRVIEPALTNIKEELNYD